MTAPKPRQQCPGCGKTFSANKDGRLQKHQSATPHALGHRMLPCTQEAASPLPLESLVEYHGSETEVHGRYRVWRHDEPMPQPLLSDEELADHYPDGVAYSLWPEGVERRFGMRHLVVSNVRRSSLTVVE